MTHRNHYYRSGMLFIDKTGTFLFPFLSKASYYIVLGWDRD